MFIDFDAVVVPKKITPCPIAEAVIELRFESTVPLDAIFGMIYSKVNKQFSKSTPLPIVQLPEMVRSNEAALKFLPYYQCFGSDDFLLQIGGRVISLHSRSNYCGWPAFSEKIREIVSVLTELNIIEKYLRVGARYINNFPENIFSNINLSIQMNSVPVVDYQTNLLLQIPYKKFLNSLRLNTQADLQTTEGNRKVSIIDIDTATEECAGDVLSIINEAHETEKKLFFGLLKNSYVANNFTVKY
jgi:uncharacterized protein (TIGR04255 family)